MGSHEAFSFPGQNTAVTLAPKQVREIEVAFHPPAIGNFEGALKVRVAENPFDAAAVLLRGECYEQMIAFDDLPTLPGSQEVGSDETSGEGKDLIDFGTVACSASGNLSFYLANLSTHTVRFDWKVPEHLQSILEVSPALGHIPAGDRRGMRITFNPIEKMPTGQPDAAAAAPAKGAKAPAKGAPAAGAADGGALPSGAHLLKEILHCETAAIVLEGGVEAELRDWDDRRSTVRWEGGQRLHDPVPEPAHQVLQAEGEEDASKYALTLPLLCKGVSAVPQAVLQDFPEGCSAESGLQLRNTLMFQTRSTGFVLSNPSGVPLAYSWSVTEADGSAAVDDDIMVTPISGEIPPEGTEHMTVKLTPSEVHHYNRRLVLQCPLVPADRLPAPLTVTAKSSRPLCHFELPASDYLSGGRRSPSRTPALDASTKVVEIDTVGVRVRATKRFYLVNPTNMSYEYTWAPNGGDAEGAIRCTTKRGVVLAGKKAEIVFEYVPAVLSEVEALYTFKIAEHGVSVSVLVVGRAAEPDVSFDRPFVNFNRLLLGAKASQEVRLVNNHHIPFAFVVESLGETDGSAIRVQPPNGTLPANGSLPLTIHFKPDEEKVYNNTVSVAVKNRPSRVQLNVKGEGYAVHERLEVQPFVEGGQSMTLQAGAPTTLDFGEVHINERQVRRISMINSGSLAYDYEWQVPAGYEELLTVEPLRGSVPVGGRAMVEIAYRPPDDTSRSNLDAVKIECRVGGIDRRYRLLLGGKGSKPMLYFSFFRHDFGPVLMAHPNRPATEIMLEVRNGDARKEVALDPLYDAVAAGTPEVDIEAAPTVLAPGQMVAIPIRVAPREVGRKVAATIPFEINGLYRTSVLVSFVGTELDVVIAKPESKVVNFGSLRPGQSVNRTVKLVNRSKATVMLDIAEIAGELLQYGVSISHAALFNLRPRDTIQFGLTFSPSARYRPFRLPFKASAMGEDIVLGEISGACLGVEIKLESESLPFPAVAHGSSVTRRIQMQNHGDIGTRFKWDLHSFAPDFSIAPADGFLGPSEDLHLTVTFHPAALSPDIRYDRLLCMIDGASPLFLTLSGSCVETPPAQNEPLSFRCPVRGSQSQSVSLSNPTDRAWTLRPAIDHACWKGPLALEVPAGGKADYAITFAPQRMASDESPHEGSLFFPLPNGTAVLYALRGVTDLPPSEGTRQVEGPAKKPMTVALPVTNWLSEAQRFSVRIDRGDETEKYVVLRGLDHLDVPASLEREYRLSVLAHRPGKTSAKVTFTNEVTNEFLFYELEVNATDPGILEVIQVETPVRVATVRSVTLENPLDEAVELQVKSDAGGVLTVPSTLSIPARGVGTLQISYRPLVPTATDGTPQQATVTASSAALGDFKYALSLKALAAAAEKSVHFRVGLGQEQTQTIRFFHFANSKVDYQVRVEGASGSSVEDFTAPKTVAVNPAESEDGVEATLEVVYEPSQLGDVRGTLIITSPVGGDYTIPLFGHAVAPQPQGPFVIKAGASAAIPFKNVFNKALDYVFTCDNVAFQVKPSENIAPKKPTSIAVTFKPANAGEVIMGRLSVRSKDPDSPTWVFFLKGDK